jgi:hypothetical protein
MNEENINYELIDSSFNLLEIGKNLAKNKKHDEKNLIIIGDKSSGKSNLFNNVLMSMSQKDSYTATCGINYGFMRYQPSTNKKFILNIYEIGGGISNLSLIKSILNSKNLNNTSILLNLDLSKGNSILKSFKNYLKELNLILKELNQDMLIEVIETKRSKYKDINSNDFKRINIFPIQLIVIGNKYDALEKIDLEKIKWTCKTLRYYCHVNALSLVYFKAGDSKLSKILNNLITSLAFNVNSENALNLSQKNEILPLYILHGNDSLIEIGDPKVVSQGGKDLNSLWDDTFSSIFNKEDENDENETNNKFEESLKERYKEPRIDEELIIFE